jgi:glutathione S-transferase
MKLIYSPGSPFARKVRIVLAEKGVEAELVAVETYDSAVLNAANPIGQVPALVLDDGSSLFDSGVICAWLDTLPGGPRLIPDGEAQWPVRRLEAAADAVMENIVKLRIETMRAEEKRSPERLATLARKTRSALDALDAQGPDAAFDLGEIALAVALDYIDFRAPELDWRAGRPNLAARWERLRPRPSFEATKPQ